MNSKNIKLGVLSLAVSLAFASSNQAQIISTYAGVGFQGYGGDGGAATAAMLNQPYLIATDGNGNLYACDFGNNVIRMINNSGIISTFAGNNIQGFSGDGGQAISAEFNGPTAILPLASGTDFLICDQYNFRIRQINSSGTINTEAGNGTNGFAGDGGPATSAELTYPTGIATDGAGNIFISDYSSQRIRKINALGVISTYAGTGTIGYSGDGGQAALATLHSPCCLTMAPGDTLYVTDQGNNVVRKISPAGIISTVAGNGNSGIGGDGGPATLAFLHTPGGICIDGQHNLFIADQLNNKVRKVNNSGIISTIAGTGTAGYSGDGGPATAATMNDPFGLTLDALGNLYVSEVQNHVIRKIAGVAANIQSNPTNLPQTRIFPNPCGGDFSIHYDFSNQGMSIAVFSLFDLSGKLMDTVTLPTNKNEIQIHLDDIPAGMYLYSIKLGVKIQMGKLAVTE